MTKMPHLIFVYGTLKRGFPNHALLDGARFVGEATTLERYPMIVQGRYFSPVVIPEAGTGHHIVGEIWEVDDERLAALDELETTHLPTGYIRQSIDIAMTATDARLTADIYFKPRDRVKIVHSEPHADYQDRRYVHDRDRPS